MRTRETLLNEFINNSVIHAKARRGINSTLTSLCSTECAVTSRGRAERFLAAIPTRFRVT